MHEIITLQLGQRSNYVATHFWNSQESYFTYSADQESLVDHDIHFRAGIGVDGIETFTPRTVIYDLKGGFGTLRKINALYEQREADSMPKGLWNGSAILQKQPAIEQNAYQRSLEEGLVPPKLTSESVRYWSDFNRVYFHPKSIVQLNEYELNSSLMPFEMWTAGEDLFGSLDKEHDLLDRDLRPFAEEADQMQAVQMMTSVDDAWGGFAARYMDRVRDEYGKTAVWVWALEDDTNNTQRGKQYAKLSNTARSISEISSQASQFIPMTVPSDNLPAYVTLDRNSPWHVSALISTALESMTLPSRLKGKNGMRETMDELAAALNTNGNQNIAKLRMSIGPTLTPAQQNDHTQSGIVAVHGQNVDPRMPSREGWAERVGLSDGAASSPLDIDFFPWNEPNQVRGHLKTKALHIFGEVESLRSHKEELPKNGVDNGEHSVDGRERARRRAAGLPIVHRTQIPLPFTLLDSFPRIYSPMLSSLDSNSVSVQASLSTDTSVAFRIKTLQRVVRAAVSADEREALNNSLAAIAEAYEEGWDSGSEEDED